MNDLKALVDVLRESDRIESPAAGLEGLAGLTEQVRAAGVAVTVAESGERADVPAPVATAVYRVVQESLTNTVRMPGLDGIAATRQIMADPDLRGCRVGTLTTFETDEYVFAALEAGASGFLTEEVDPEGLRHAVRVVAAGEALLSPSVTRRVVKQFAHRPAPAPGGGTRLAALTAREREVVRLVATGLSNEDIARELVISPLTAKTHITRAITELGVRDRVQLVILAYEEGLVGR